MLRLWIDQLRIYLHPEQVVIVRLSGLVKRRIIAKRVLPVDVAGEFAWSGALAVLEAALKQAEWQGARAMVILAGHYTQYRVTPWNDDLTAAEQSVLLHHQFADIYGERANNWQIKIADGAYAKPSVACVVDSRLMEGLQKTCSATRVQLTSVQPYLMTAFNRWRKQIDPQGAWLVLREKSHLSIAFFQGGAWRTMRTQCCSSDWAVTLELMLVREALQLGVDAAAFMVYFFSAEFNGKSKLPVCFSAPFKVQILHLPAIDGYLPQDDLHIAAALCL